MCTCVRARLCVCVCSNHNGYLCFKRLDNIELKANDRGFSHRGRCFYFPRARLNEQTSVQCIHSDHNKLTTKIQQTIFSTVKKYRPGYNTNLRKSSIF